MMDICLVILSKGFLFMKDKKRKKEKKNGQHFLRGDWRRPGLASRSLLCCPRPKLLNNR